MRGMTYQSVDHWRNSGRHAWKTQHSWASIPGEGGLWTDSRDKSHLLQFMLSKQWELMCWGNVSRQLEELSMCYKALHGKIPWRDSFAHLFGLRTSSLSRRNIGLQCSAYMKREQKILLQGIPKSPQFQQKSRNVQCIVLMKNDLMT